jgi:hypothetical protein
MSFTSSSTDSTTPRQFSSTTRGFASSTGQFQNQNNKTFSIVSPIAPMLTLVTTGISDDTNTEIVSGVEKGQFVVTRTIAASGSQTTATAPTLFSSLGSRNGAPAGGATRTGAAGMR